MRKVISFHPQSLVNFSLHVGITLHCCSPTPSECLLEVDVACFIVCLCGVRLKRAVALLLFFFFCSFSPCSRSCLVNPMKRNVLSTGKPQQCPSVLTNSKHRMCLPAGNGVQFCVAWTWCYAASLCSAFFN